MVEPFDWPTRNRVRDPQETLGCHCKENPTYKEAHEAEQQDIEVVQITFDPEVFPYEKLVEVLLATNGLNGCNGDNSWTVEIHTAQLSSIIRKNKKDCGSFKAALQASGRFKKIS